MLVPGVFEDLLAMEAGDTIKLQIAEENDFTCRVVVRGLVNQLPGQQFTDYQTTMEIYASMGGVPVVIPMTDYKLIIDQIWDRFPERYAAYKNATAGYEFVDEIPKHKCFIKLNPDITPAQQT